MSGAFIDAVWSDPSEPSARAGPYVSTRSAADGTFTMHVPGTGITFIRARGPNVASEQRDIRIGEGDVRDVTLLLDAPGEPGTMEGRVLLEGRPMAGVRVVLRPNEFRNAAIASELTGVDGIYRVAPGWSGIEEIDIDASAIGMGKIRRWAKFAVRAGRAESDVEMPRPWSIAGRVTRGAAGVAGARVAARATLGTRESDISVAIAEPSGTFRIVGLFDRRPSVTLQVTAPDGDSSIHSEPFGVEDWNLSGVTIEMSASGRIRGRVLDAVGRPIVGARVHARNVVVSTSDGRFDVFADPGRARVAVSCQGYVDHLTAWLEVPVGDRGVEVDVVLEPRPTGAEPR